MLKILKKGFVSCNFRVETKATNVFSFMYNDRYVGRTKRGECFMIMF